MHNKTIIITQTFELNYYLFESF